MNLRTAFAVFFAFSYLAYCNAEEQLLHRELTDLVSKMDSSKKSPGPTPMPEMCDPELKECKHPDFKCVCECSEPDEPTPEPTPAPTPEGVCAGRCDGNVPRPGTTPCYCDELCTCYGDCCYDYNATLCGHNATLNSCAISDPPNFGCGNTFGCNPNATSVDPDVANAVCKCDVNCTFFGDCCGDFNSTCNIASAAVSATGMSRRPRTDPAVRPQFLK